MKDGVNSANRYYLNRFRDAYRQAVIGRRTNLVVYMYLYPEGLVWFFFLSSADLMMGLPVTEDLYSIFSKEKEHEEKEKESQRGAQEQVSILLQTYMQLLLPDDEKFHGGWALINCDMRFVVNWLITHCWNWALWPISVFWCALPLRCEMLARSSKTNVTILFVYLTF